MLKNFFRKTPPLKDTLDDVIIALGRQKRKLELIDAKLKARRSELFRLCTQALQKKSSERAKIYANEIAEIKKMQEKVSNGLLILEQLMLRMETLRDIGSTFAQLEPTLEVVRQVSEQLSEVIPEVSGELERIGSCLNTLIAETKMPVAEVELIAISDSNENEAILDEASNYLRGRLMERLPEPPKGISHGAMPSRVCDLSSRPIPRVNDREKEMAVLEYLEENGGMLDVKECEERCGIDERQLTRVIESLSKKGMIKILTASEAIADDGN